MCSTEHSVQGEEGRAFCSGENSLSSQFPRLEAARASPQFPPVCPTPPGQPSLDSFPSSFCKDAAIRSWLSCLWQLSAFSPSSQNPRTVWVGGTLKLIQCHPCQGRDTFPCPRLLQAPPAWPGPLLLPLKDSSNQLITHLIS